MSQLSGKYRYVRRIAALIALSGLVALGSPGTAGAADVAVAATVLGGTRTITTATLTPFADALRTASVTSTLAVTVTEDVVSGVTPWSVTTRLCGPDGVGTAADCTADPDRIVLSTDTTKKITGANLAISGRSVTATLGGGTSTAVTGSEDLSIARTLFTNTGQDPLLTYTGTYAGSATLTLTPPSTATPGAYTGYLVVTLVS